jgi:hypothetical protein
VPIFLVFTDDDLASDRNVSIWNVELLHLGGYLSRVAYETELATISRLYIAALQTSSSALSGPDANLTTWLQSRCLHALKFFTFRPSTPSPEVSRIMQSTFFNASEMFSVFSTSGVKPASEIRIRNVEMEKFIKALPVLPREIQDGASDVIAVLQGKNMIKQISFDDVIAEMRGRCFEEDEMIECLKWRVGLPRQAAFDAHFKEQFVNAGVFRIAGKKADTGDIAKTQEERIVPLLTVKHYINTNGLVPLDVPLPTSVLPLKFSTTKGMTTSSFFDLFGWGPFSINDWVVYLSSRPPAESPDAEHNITLSPIFAERVLSSIAKGWPNISKSNQDDIVQRLSPLSWIPTQLGLKVPSDVYFPAAHVFQDLPMVTLSGPGAMTGKMKTPMENLLAAVGVRKHVDLQVVFNRMIKTGDWTIPQLVKYLAGVRDTLTREEIERLKQTAAFSREGDPVPPKPDPSTANGSATPVPRRPRFKIGTLYEPIDALRKLNLPLLDWGDNPKWRAGSDEGELHISYYCSNIILTLSIAKFLFMLGLLRYPPLAEIIKMAGGPDPTQREVALKYFFEKYTSQYQDFIPSNFANIAFIPAIRADGTEFVARPNEVMSSS